VLTNFVVRCSHPDYPVLSLEQILKPHSYILDPQADQEVILPFVNAKYKANVRVIGYFPHDLRDFAVGRRATEYDMLSDYSGGEETDLEEDARLFKAGKGFGQKKWEWRFAVEVEDASSKTPKERMWLHVDNHAAQALLDLDAAK
jgi:protection-of-telomeres protein 1